MGPVLLDLQYLPNIEWMACFLACDTVMVEGEENFVKSTFRNRCEIAGAEGKLTLSIPLEGGRDHHQKYAATRITFTNTWQRAHWHSITAAYGSAPFFDFYRDRLEPFYTQRFDLLFHFNLQLLRVLLQMLKAKKQFNISTVYEPLPVDMLDLRSTRLSSSNQPSNQPRYYQVFEDRNGFIPNLSVIDLIFNEGPQGLAYLEKLAEAMRNSQCY